MRQAMEEVMGCRRFEIGLYNTEVRNCLAEGASHRDLSDEWADIHYIEVTAESSGEARQRIEQRYPQALGFTITEVTPLER